MTPRAIRRVVWVVGLVGLAGIIGASIAANTGLAIVSGIVSALSVCALILVTSVTGPTGFTRPSDAERSSPTYDPTAAAEVEDRIRALVDGGADEAAVRQLVTRAVDLGHGRR